MSHNKLMKLNKWNTANMDPPCQQLNTDRYPAGHGNDRNSISHFPVSANRDDVSQGSLSLHFARSLMQFVQVERTSSGESDAREKIRVMTLSPTNSLRGNGCEIKRIPFRASPFPLQNTTIHLSGSENRTHASWLFFQDTGEGNEGLEGRGKSTALD